MRHLQDMHSGISYLCLLCGQIYARRTIPHACNAKEKDFIYIHGESGIQGEAARKILEKFINERLEKNWKYVAAEDCAAAASTPQYQVKSSVKRIEKGRVPNKNDKKKDHQERAYSPIPLGDDPQIEVGEAPLFDPPVPVLETDPDYVNSLEELAARILPQETSRQSTQSSSETAQTTTTTEKDETAECTKILENILDNMNQLQAPQNHPQTQHNPQETEQNTQQTKTTDENNNIEHEKSKENTEETSQRSENVNIPTNQEHQQTEEEEKRLRREKRKQRKAERKRLRDIENQLNDAEDVNKKNKTENEHIIINETENNDGIDMDPENVILQPIMTLPDRLAEERQNLENDLRAKQSGRVTLDVGGRHFATSKGTLLKDKNSLFNILLDDQKTHYFIDRDGAHFRYILNYLREDCAMDIAILPRETRYLKELRNECIYYKLTGLLEIVDTRLDQYRSLGLAF